MWLNVERVELRKTYRALRAIQDAMSGGIPEPYFHATADTPDEAAAAFARYLALRPVVEPEPGGPA